MMETFPSVGWFEGLAEHMAAEAEKFRRLGPLDLTLVARIDFTDGRSELFSLAFAGYRPPVVGHPAGPEGIDGRHPVILEGEYAVWKEMVENIRRHGHADLEHTLNYLTLPDWPFRLVPVDTDQGQLDVDRFYRYNASLQEFFDGAAGLETRFAANGR